MKARHILLPAALAALGLEQAHRLTFARDPGPLKILTENYTHKAAFYIHKRQRARALAERPCIRHSRVNRRGQRLAGFYYPCSEKPCGKIAFVLHGYRSDHEDTGGLLMEHWFSRGFDLFVCDHAAAGESDGKYLSFGGYESLDCLDWLDFLAEQYGEDVKIVIHGLSMGGATAMLMSDRLPENVRFIIEDSGYSSASGLLREKLGLLYQPVRLLNRLITGCDVEEQDVRPHLERADIPILFIHGSADVTVPYDMGIELHAMYRGEKDCLFLPGVAHIEPVYTNPVEYGEKMDKFIEKYF